MLSLVIQILWWERAQVLQTGEPASGDFMGRKWSSRAARKWGGGGKGQGKDGLARQGLHHHLVFFLRVGWKNRRQRDTLTDWQK